MSVRPQYRIYADQGGVDAACEVLARTGAYSAERARRVAALTAVVVAVVGAGVACTALVAWLAGDAVAAVVPLAVGVACSLAVAPWWQAQRWRLRGGLAYVVSEVVLRAELPEGSPSQTAARFLTNRFGDAGRLADDHHEVELVVQQVLADVDGGLPGARSGVVRRWWVRRLAPRLADLGVSLAMARGDMDYAAAGRDALAWTAQLPDRVLRVAARAWVTELLLGAAVFAAAAYGFGALAVFLSLYSAVAAAVALAVTLPASALVAWAVHLAWLEPIGLTMVVVRFHDAIQGQRLEPAVRARVCAAARCGGSGGAVWVAREA